MAGGRKSDAERLKSKLRKKLKQINHLEMLQRPLSREELAKVRRKAEFMNQLAALNKVGEAEEAEKAEEMEGAKDEKSETGEAEDEENEAMALHRQLLWGEERQVEYSVGHVRDLAPSHAELAATATESYKRFKEEEAKCSYGVWREVAGEGWINEMLRNNNKMRSCLDRAIAHYRVALAKAQAAGAREAGRSVARNLLLCLSQLVARVRPHLRIAIYTEAAATFATALELGGEDKAWLWPETRRGVVTVFEDMVEELSSELSGLATTPRQLVRAGEAVCRSLDRWSKVEESRATLGLLNLRVGEVVFNRWVARKLRIQSPIFAYAAPNVHIMHRPKLALHTKYQIQFKTG